MSSASAAHTAAGSPLDPDTLAPDVTDALDHLAQVTGMACFTGKDIIRRSGMLRQQMNLAASRLRRAIDKSAPDGADRQKLEQEYVRACSLRTVADSVLASAFALDKHLGGDVPAPTTPASDETGTRDASAPPGRFRDRRSGGGASRHTPRPDRTARRG